MNLDRGPLFEELGIAVRKREAAPFFFGDNLDGYFEGRTFRLAEGSGYVVRGRAVFRDFLSWRGTLPNPRDRADAAVIFPYGVRHIHSPAMWDELCVLHKRRAVAVRIHSDRADRLALAPLLDLRGRDVAVDERQGLVLIHPSRGGLFIACASHQMFRPDGVEIRERMVAPVLRTLQPENEFTLYVAFSSDPGRALEQAGRLRDQDALEQHQRHIYDALVRSHVWTSDAAYNRALMWAKISSYFMLNEDCGHGLWAGLPWFRESWGRDTFISLPGALLAGGFFAEAREVIRSFARLQQTDAGSPDFGRIPNRVSRPSDAIYNTADGTPWMIREIQEYLDYTGDTAFAEEIYPFVQRALDGATKHRVDKEGFLTHDDADTWMDARIDGSLPWSPRGNRACEIQALWHESLLAGARLAEIGRDTRRARAWRKAAALLRKRFAARFWNAKKKLMADRVRGDGRADYRVRPNQLLLLTVPRGESFLDEKVERSVLENAVSGVLLPHGVASLSPGDPYFHPAHDGQPQYHKDAAYHNGTVWGWNAGFAVSALCRHGQVELASQLAGSLAEQILKLGCRGAMSELLDAVPGPKGRLQPSGTWAQTWSTAEFARNGYQDFGGFGPRMLENRIAFEPRLPEAWTRFSGSFPFGRAGRFLANFAREKGREVWVLTIQEHIQPVAVSFSVCSSGRCYRFEWPLKATDTVAVVFDGRKATVALNGTWQEKAPAGDVVPKTKRLEFARLPKGAGRNVLKAKDVLRKAIEAGKVG